MKRKLIERLKIRLRMARVVAMGIPLVAAQNANNDHSVTEIIKSYVTRTITKNNSMFSSCICSRCVRSNMPRIPALKMPLCCSA